MHRLRPGAAAPGPVRPAHNPRAPRRGPRTLRLLPAPRRPARRVRQRGQPYLLVLPALAVIGVLVIYPLVLSLWDSGHADNLALPSRAFVGARNYTTVLTDPDFVQASLNTIGYLVLATAGSLLVGAAMAFWLHNVTRLRAAALAVVMLPWAVPGTVIGALWSLIFNPQTGLLDGVLVGLHLISHPVIWLEGSGTGIVFISITLIWQISPITAVILLAGLESIPPTLLEQAATDGATRRAILRKLTLPLLRPALAVGLLQASVLGIGIFDEIIVLNGYSPGTLSVVMQVYIYAFRDLNFGLGIAASMIVTGGTLLISIGYLKGLYREVRY